MSLVAHRPYETVFYNTIGQHSARYAGMNYSDAYKDALQALNEFKNDEGLQYIGLESNERFAVMYVTQEYIDYCKSLPDQGFSDSKSAETWFKVAEACLHSGKPAEGVFKDK